MRKCASVHTHTHMHNIYMYVCKWEKSTMGVGSCHFACPCMSVHAYNTIFHVVFLCTIFTHFLTSVAVRRRETEIDVAKISFFPFWLTICWRKLWIWICCFCCCCKWVLKYTHKMLPIYTMHTHTYRAHICVCDCVCECVYVIMWNCVFVGVCVMCVLYRYTTIYKRRRYDDNQKTQLAAGECKN